MLGELVLSLSANFDFFLFVSEIEVGFFGVWKHFGAFRSLKNSST